MKKGRKYYHNGVIEVCISPDEPAPEGFKRGRLATAGSIYVHKGDKSKRIKKDLLRKHLKAG